MQALAAVLGGTQSLHTIGYDETLALPTEEAARIALRTQQIIAYESGAPQTTDPLGGSYCIESLTQQLEQKAEQYLGKIDALGGVLKAISKGFMQQEIQNAAYEFQQAADNGEAVIVGVNRFQIEEEQPVPIQRIEEELERKQVERLRALRARREQAAWEKSLRAVADAARSGSNLMPHIVAATESYATLGEISDALRQVFGEHQETLAI